VSFRTWFQRYYQQAGERKTNAFKRFAKQVGVSYATTYLLYDARPVSRRMGSKIRGVTGGRVSVKNMVLPNEQR
jgi:hypothetical protein